jgi:TonB family protein
VHLAALYLAAAVTCSVPNKDATVTHMVSPDFPQSARTFSRFVGTARVAVTVSPTGTMESARIVQSTGNFALDQAALMAARQSTYSPKVVDCQPVTGDYLFMVTFDAAGGEQAAPCIVNVADVVSLVRAKMPMGSTVRVITVSGAYAIVAAYGPGGYAARSYLLRNHNGWKVLTSEGGAFDLATLQRYGVPLSVAQTLWTSNCP